MLVGNCNQCGICCMEGNARCCFLEVLGPIGNPGATRCTVHDKRYPGLPIVMIEGKSVVNIGACAHGSSVDDLVIIQKGIGKGCSLTFVEDKL